MKEKFGKVVGFLAEHKESIIKTGVVIAGGIVGLVLVGLITRETPVADAVEGLSEAAEQVLES